MKKIYSIAILTIFSFVLCAAPLYQGETLPSAGSDLPGATVVFTVPTDVSLAFSTDPNQVIDPGTIDLTVETEVEDGSFYIGHKNLYALWNIDPDTNEKFPFGVYLYLAGPLKDDTTGNELHWTVAGGHATVGGADGEYCTSEAFDKNCAVEIADGKLVGYVPLIINLNINEMITSGTIEDGTYTGSICLHYENGG